MTLTAEKPSSQTLANPTPRGPIGRIIVGSLLTGVAGAAVLTLVAFPGAPEHVITGTTLLAFAAGWAMLAFLSGRFTDQPQRWAHVPAAVMGATGAGLLVTAPRTTALTDAGWVWPPVMLALAAWMFVQIRQALRSRARWLLYPVIGALALASVGGVVETVSLHRDAATLTMPGHLYDIGARRLHMHCVGAGRPTVVLESGLGNMSSNWAWISTAVAPTARVCAYDRAGQGWSDDAPHPQDGIAVARDLHALLAVAGERGPFVLVGHSTGGTYVMTYAARYPSQVAGVVLLDSSSPHQFALPGYASTYAMMRRGIGIAPSLLRLGVGRLVPASAVSSLPSPAADQLRAFLVTSRGLRNMRDDLSQLPAVFAQARALHTLGSKPLVVLTTTDSLHTTAGWSKSQDELAALSANSSHRVVDATHAGVLDDPTDYVPSVRAITDVVHAVRTATPLPTR